MANDKYVTPVVQHELQLFCIPVATFYEDDMLPFLQTFC